MSETSQYMASQLAVFCGQTLEGADIPITQVCSLERMQTGALVFLTRKDERVIAELNRLKQLLCVTTSDISKELQCSIIVQQRPRLAFCKLLAEFFSELARPYGDGHIASNARIAKSAVIEQGASIGECSCIGENVVIRANVRLGQHCNIKSNTTIGERGFGFEKDEDGTPIPFPHIGGVHIGDHVEIGANCTVACASLDDTLIEDHVKLDDQVHVAHNCRIGSRTQIAAGVTLSGSTVIGQDVWISPGVTAIDYCTIGDNAFIGIGSVVTKPVRSNDRIFGNPAQSIKRHNRSTGQE